MAENNQDPSREDLEAEISKLQGELTGDVTLQQERLVELFTERDRDNVSKTWWYQAAMMTAMIMATTAPFYVLRPVKDSFFIGAFMYYIAAGAALLTGLIGVIIPDIVRYFRSGRKLRRQIKDANEELTSKLDTLRQKHGELIWHDALNDVVAESDAMGLYEDDPERKDGNNDD